MMNVEPIVCRLCCGTSLWSQWDCFDLNSKKYYVVCCINCVLLLGILVSFEAVRTLPPICGIIAAAAVICVSRALTVMSKPDSVCERGPILRHLYYFCVFGWHDFRSKFEK